MPEPIQTSDPVAGNQVEGQNVPASTPAPAASFIEQAAGQSQPPEATPEAKATEAQLAGWTNATTKELRADPRFAPFASKYSKFDEVVKSAMELEAKAQSLVEIPGQDEDPEKVASFYEKLGVPKDSSEYELDLDPALSYDEKELGEYKALAHKLHLTKDQAKELHKLSTDAAKGILEAERTKAKAQKEEQAADLARELKKQWGKDYDVQHELVVRGVKAYGSPELLQELSAAGIGNSIHVVNLFNRLGQLTREDSAVGLKSGRTSEPKSIADRLYPGT